MKAHIMYTCTRCSNTKPFVGLNGRCTCGGTRLLSYDPEFARRKWDAAMQDRHTVGLWRYRGLLPVDDPSNEVTLGEGGTPLVRLPQLERALSVSGIWVKREEQNPTGSFKARGMAVAVSLAKEYGIRKVAVPSNGNAASALAAYAARAGMKAYMFLPADCPPIIIKECLGYGGDVSLVDGMIHDCSRIVENGERSQEWLHVGTLREPGRVEGKKTMGFEIAEQMQLKLPDVIVYPTGGGSGIIGLWKAFRELKAIGVVEGGLPRLIAVQETGCTPLVHALRSADDVRTQPPDSTSSFPSGMRVPQPPDAALSLNILSESGGMAIAVSGEEIASAQQWMGLQGISSSHEGAAALAGLIRLRDNGDVRSSDRVVLFNTAHALKYVPYRLIEPVNIITTFQDWLNLRSEQVQSGSGREANEIRYFHKA